jgi:nucleoside-diphosphate-sugar epimerase
VDLSGSDIATVAVVGGSGRLGSSLVRVLLAADRRVVVLDAQPPEPLPGVRFVRCDLGRREPLPPAAVAGCDAVVHLAALHGAHLVAGTPRTAFWEVNVHGTQRVLDAAAAAGVRRVVLASSTSIYGSGSGPGQPARILDERTALDPEDVYDLTKIAAEHLLRDRTAPGVGVALRFGRFFFPSQAGYHLRKLSTGLDVHDANQAIVRALTAPAPPRPAYCVASDLALSEEDRRRLGTDVRAVLDRALPGFAESARQRGIELPERVGKSVSTALARAELGYRPERALDWVSRTWAPGRTAPGRRRPLRDVLLSGPALPTPS